VKEIDFCLRRKIKNGQKGIQCGVKEKGTRDKGWAVLSC